MGAVEEEIRRIVDAEYPSYAAFARAIGAREQTVYSLLNGGNILKSHTQLALAICRELSLEPEWLLDGKVVAKAPHTEPFVEVPLLGTIAAGQPFDWIEAREHVAIPSAVAQRWPDAFALRVSGESMNREVPNGSFAIIDPCESIDEPGEVYALDMPGEGATLKRAFFLEKALELRPNSDDDSICPIQVRADDLPQLHVIGRLAWHVPPVDISYRRARR